MKQFKLTERIISRESKTLSLYFNDLNKMGLLTIEEEIELCSRMKDGDISAREELIKGNLKFVISVARSYARSSDDLDDLISAGNIGLITAADKFDATKGFKFISFAVWYIRAEIFNAINILNRPIRIPQGQISLLKAIKDITNKVSVLEGRNITTDEIVEMLKNDNPEKYNSISPVILENAIIANQKLENLDRAMYEDSAITLIDTLDGGFEEPDSELIKENIENALVFIMDTLTHEEVQVILSRHNVHPYDNYEGKMGVRSFTNIGKYLSPLRNQEQAKTLYHRGLFKMKKRILRSKYSLSDVI
jgi:RNA polymerase primary sigma factor